MAVFYGTQATLTKASQTSPIVNSEPNDFAGRVRVFWETYTVVSASAVDENDTIQMGGGLIPKGARIIDGWFDWSADLSDEACALAVTTVSTGGTTTIILNAVDVSTTPTLRRTLSADNATLGTVMDSDAQVTITLTGELNTDAAVITLCLLYVID